MKICLNSFHIITPNRMKLRFLNTLIIITVCICFNFVSINCDSEDEEKIKFKNQVYSHLSQIPLAYNIVKQNNLGGNLDSKEPVIDVQTINSQKFAQKQIPGFYVSKASDTQYQTKKYSNIKGKNIFSSQYISSKLYDPSQIIPQHIDNFILLPEDMKEEFSEKIDWTPQPQPQAHPDEVKQLQPHTDEVKQLIIEEKSNQLYNEFKTMDILKQKNLRQIIKTISPEGNQDYYKIIISVILVLILFFAVVKKATKSEPSLSQKNEQKRELRLRDTVDDDEQDGSSQSDD